MIRLQTLGGLDLSDTDGRAVHSVLQQPRRVALLVYLALARPDRWYRRDTLLAMFWPEADAEHARGSLSQALYQLRRTLGGDAISSRGAEMVGLASSVWCDATELARLLGEGNADDAIALYRGAFLDGFFISDAPEFDHWVDGERERIRDVAIEAFAAAAEAAARSGANARAVELARRAVAAAPTDEVALRRLLSLLVRFGDRAGALRTYESFAARLHTEYELTPSASTRELVETLRAEDVARPAESRSPEAPRVVTTPIVPRVEKPDVIPVKSWRSFALAAATVVTLLVAGFFWYRENRVAGSVALAGSAVPLAGVAAGPSVAVLPFLNLNADGESDYFSDGLAEQLLTALTRIPSLRVAARTSAFAFRRTNASVQEIARALNVTHVVEGSVRKSGVRLLITIRLVDTRTGAPTWSATYDRTLDDIFAVQEEIARAVVTAIEPRLLRDSNVAVARTTTSLEAYNEYLKGRYHFNMRSPDHAWLGVHAFEQAIALDSTFAPAWSGLADSYALLPYYGIATGDEILPRARAAARRAVSLDSTLAEPHSTLGWIAFTYEWDFAAATREFETALRLNPNYPDALHFYSLFLSRVMGDRDQARAIVQRALRLDPLAPVIQAGAGGVYYYTRGFDESIAAYRHALALDSTYWVVRGLLSETYVAAGRPADAIRELRLIPPTIQPIHGGPAMMGAAFARLGMRDSALAMLQVARARRETKPYQLAILYVALGDTNAAFAALDHAVTVRDPFIIMMRNDPLFDGLRSDPRFDRISDRMKLPR